ncbi:hypothetical protein D3C76_1182490 [compost metagenome]
MLGQRFSDHTEVRVAFFHAEDRRAAHAVQRLEDDIAVLLPEGFQLRFVARDECFRRQVGEPGGIQLLVTVAQALRFVNDQRAFLFRALKDIGAVDEFGVERRIFTHQDHVEIGKRNILLRTELVPFIVILLDVNDARAGAGFTVVQVKIGHFHVMELVAATLCFQQHSEAGIFLDVNACDGVHHDAELDHCSSPLMLQPRSPKRTCSAVMAVSAVVSVRRTRGPNRISVN